MITNGKRRHHVCTEPGFFEQPRWLSDGQGAMMGAEHCPRCLSALTRLYGMAGAIMYGKGVYTTASKDIVIDEERFNASYQQAQDR